ncbi:MAG: MFS transporter [Bacillota bacterium]
MLRRKLGICSYIVDERERHNALTSIADGMWYAVMAGLTTPFWGAFAVRLGATDYMIALLSSLPALVNLLSQVPSAIIIDRFDTRLRPVVVWAMLERVFFLVFALLAVLPIPSGAKPMLFIILYSLKSFPATTCGIAWTSMMGEMFNPRLRGRLFGERNMLCTLVTLTSTIAAGPLLDRIQWPWNYFTIYTASFIALALSTYYLFKHRETPLAREERAQSPSGLPAFVAAVRDRPFAKFLAAVMAMHIGFHVPASLWTILWVRIMGLSNAWIGMFSTVSGVTSVLSYRAWGRWTEKYGNPIVLSVTALAHIAVPVIYAHFPSPYVYLGINAFGGFVGAGLNLALFNLLLDVSPAAGRPAYVATYNMVLGVSGFVWPFLGVFMYERLGMTVALDWSAALRAAGMIAATLVLLRGRSLETSSVGKASSV